MSVSVVSDDGSWTATADKEFHFDFSTGDGQVKLNVVGKEDGKIDGNVTLGPLDIGTKDNHISVGGGSQEVNYDGSLKFGKTKVNLLGGSFDLGEGRTDDFQFSFTREPTPLGPQWTGIATNNFVETKSFEIQGMDAKVKNKEAEVPLYEKKDALFDVAGVILPGCQFIEWAKQMEFKFIMDIAVDGKKATVKVTRALKFQIRPVFKPYPINTWPKRPPPPPFLDQPKRVVQDITQRLVERKVVLQFVDSSLQEVHTWQTVESALNAVSIASTAVTAATAAFGIAVAAAAAFLEMNPIADAAEVSASATLVAELAELATAKGAVTAAKALLKWGAERLTSATIVTRAATTVALSSTAIVAGTSLSAAAVNDGAATFFNNLARSHGLEAAGNDLEKMENSLTAIKSEVSSDINTLTEELQQATKAMLEAADKFHKLLEYQTLLESWTQDPRHVPFLTWLNTNLRINDGSGDVEIVQLEDIGTPQKFAVEAARMEAYAVTKGYTGFVIIPHETKAYFRNRDVADLLSTIEQQDYCKNWISYIRAQNIPMNILINRWAVIEKGEKI